MSERMFSGPHIVLFNYVPIKEQRSTGLSGFFLHPLFLGHPWEALSAP